MYVINDLGEQIMREIDASSRQFSVQAINLFPPGGIIGQLPQTKVMFDPIEAVDATIPPSGTSLITNLNRIRAGVALGDGIILERHLSSGLVIPTETRMTIQGSGGLPSYADINTIVFANGDLTLLEAGRIEVDVQTPLIDHILATTSGYITRSWFLGGTVASGVIRPAGIYQVPINALTSQITILADEVGNTDMTVTLIGSMDGVTWSGIATAIHPASAVLSTLNTVQSLASGLLVGVQVDGCPMLPGDVPFENVTIVLKTVENGGLGGGGGTLPTFTPLRVPFADNSTGLLTESSRFNLSQADSGDMLIIGGDTIANLGVSEKVGIDITRDDVDGGFIQETYSDGTFAPSFAGLRARGTRSSPTPATTGTVLFRFTGRGYTSGGWSSAPTFRVEGRATEDFTGVGRGTEAIIGITKNGDSTTTDMFRVDGDGLLVDGATRTNTLSVLDAPTLNYVLTDIDGAGTAAWRALPSGGGGIGDGAFVLYQPIAEVPTGIVRPELKNYNPDALPLSPSSYDDEFNDDALAGKWNTDTYDTAFNLYQNDGSKHLSESLRHGLVTFQGDWSYFGENFYQTFTPVDDEWTLVAKIHPSYNSGTNAMTCFGVIGAFSTVNYYQVRLGTATDNTIGAEIFYNDGGGDTSALIIRFNIDHGVYAMISKRIAEGSHIYTTFLSADGISWLPTTETTLTTMTTADLTYQYFGNFNSGGVNPLASIDFVRYFTGAGHFNIGANV